MKRVDLRLTLFILCYFCIARVISSAGLEHYLDKVGVDGSNPLSPTNKKGLVYWALFMF